MNLFDSLDNNNIDHFCIKSYDNPQCTSLEDYHNDMRRFKYIKRLLNQYSNNNVIKIRLLLNHIIMVYNIFSNDSATRILFYKIEEKHWSILKTVLIFLNRMPKSIKGINNQDIVSTDIKLDEHIVTMLREIK